MRRLDDDSSSARVSQCWGFTSCSTVSVILSKSLPLPLVGLEPTEVTAYDKMPNLLNYWATEDLLKTCEQVYIYVVLNVDNH